MEYKFKDIFKNNYICMHVQFLYYSCYVIKNKIRSSLFYRSNGSFCCGIMVSSLMMYLSQLFVDKNILQKGLLDR